jgi:hypothetical protein
MEIIYFNQIADLWEDYQIQDKLFIIHEFWALKMDSSMIQGPMLHSFHLFFHDLFVLVPTK